MSNVQDFLSQTIHNVTVMVTVLKILLGVDVKLLRLNLAVME